MTPPAPAHDILAVTIPRTKLMSAAVLMGLLAGCGPGSRFALATVVANRDGAGNVTMLGSVMVADSPGAPFHQAVHTSQLEASVSPVDLPPLNVCRVYDDVTVGASLASFTLLDPGDAWVTAPGGEVLNLAPESPPGINGLAMRGAAVEADLPFEPGQRYQINGAGAEAPGFAAEIEAPPDFEIQTIGVAGMGPGTIDLHRTRDLKLVWSPGSDADFYVTVAVTDPSPGSMVCRLSDTGEYTIKDKIVEGLPLGTGLMFFERIYDANFKTQIGPPEGRQIPARIRFASRWTAKIEVK